MSPAKFICEEMRVMQLSNQDPNMEGGQTMNIVYICNFEMLSY